MSNTSNGEIAGCLLWAFSLIISILAGVLAWNWIEPEGFFGFLSFIIMWGVFSYIGYLVGGGIVYLLFGDK